MNVTRIGNNEYIEVPVESIIDNSHSLFDVFTLVPEEFEKNKEDPLILYAKAPYHWTTGELKKLISMGVNSLFIKEADREKYDRYQSTFTEIQEQQRDLEQKFELQDVHDIATHCLEACFLSEINETLIKKIKDLGEITVDIIQEYPNALRSLKDLGEHSLYTYIHSAGVGVTSASIGKAMGIEDDETLLELTIAGFFHDIGKKEVPVAILEKKGPLSKEEWETMKSHPELGVHIAESLGFSERIMEAIACHHEKLDGTGYPQNLMGDEISEFTKILTVADIFNALTTSRCYHFKRNRFEALMFMKSELNGKISADAFKALVSIFKED